jgi:hypothetical protein
MVLREGAIPSGLKRRASKSRNKMVVTRVLRERIKRL